MGIERFSASNRLFANDCTSLAEALELYEIEHRAEAASMARICEPGDPFPAELIAIADQAGALRAEYNAALAALDQTFIDRWPASGDPVLVSLADAAEDNNWSSLAI